MSHAKQSFNVIAKTLKIHLKKTTIIFIILDQSSTFLISQNYPPFD